MGGSGWVSGDAVAEGEGESLASSQSSPVVCMTTANEANATVWPSGVARSS